MFNLVYVHLLNRTMHSEACEEKPDLGLVCSSDCGTRRFLDWLEEPLTAWEVAAEERFRERRKQLMRGEIPA